MTTLPAAAALIDPLASRPEADSGPGATPPAAWETVETARTRTRDAHAGYKTMAEHATPEFAPVVQSFLALHARHAEAFSRLLLDAGHATDEGGSVMGTVNRMVVATRAFFDGIDADVLKQIHSGEENIASAYRDALEADLPAGAHDTIAALLDELNALLARHRPVDAP